MSSPPDTDPETQEGLAAQASAVLAPLLSAHGIDAAMERMVREVYVPVTLFVAARRRALGRPAVIGVHGAQGSGKSTLAAMVGALLEGPLGLRTAVFSLDDLYLTHAERERLGRTVHPLLATRGVPGTHDVSLGHALLDDLLSAAAGEEVRLPRFDKAVDDRAPRERWPVFEGPCDVVLFEGWCVGLGSEGEEALREPVNALEREEDADGRWRRYVDAALAGPYAELFARLDALVMLAVPSMEQVVQWRTLQERKLAAARAIAGEGERIMTDAEVARFVMFFERLTRRALRELPGAADVVVRLGEDHQPVDVTFRRA